MCVILHTCFALCVGKRPSSLGVRFGTTPALSRRVTTSALIALLFASLAVGFVGSLHCVGMCGPFAALAGTRGWKGVITYSSGRLLTYGLLGAFAGLFGAALAALREVGLVVAVVILLTVSLQLAGVLPEPRIGARWSAPLVRWVQRARAGRFALGVTTALLPCGLVYAGLGVAIGAGSPLWGALAMVTFGLGTWPASLLVGVGAGRLMRVRKPVQRVAAAIVCVAGLWTLSHRAPSHLVEPPSEPGASEAAPLDQAPIPSCCAGNVSAPQ